MGQLLFYILWPLVWFYAPLRVRSSVLLVHDGKILVVKNWFGPNRMQLPGGGVKFGESTVQAAIRELNEELGVTITAKQLKRLTKNPVVYSRSGLLYREQFSLCSLDQRPDLAPSRAIIATDWIEEIDTLPSQIQRTLH